MSVFIRKSAYLIPGGSIQTVLDLAQAPFQPWDEFHAGSIELKEETSAKQLGKQDRVVRIAASLMESFRDSAAQMLILGSARGATATLEKEYQRYLDTGKVSTRTSPWTTPGNIASTAAASSGLQLQNNTLSMTCSSGMNAILQAASGIERGSFHTVIAGGVEAPLTKFTRAQFEALRLLSRESLPWPCLPLQTKRANQLVLAEGGALFELSSSEGNVKVCGWGESAQAMESDTAFAAKAVKTAMERTIAMAGYRPDLIIAHAPGTLKGDSGERDVINAVVGEKIKVFSTKKYTGHSLGASGGVSLAFALHFLKEGFAIEGGEKKKVNSVLINTTGFGGNAASLMVERS